VLDFEQFHLRGTSKASTEWTSVCLAHHLKRLHHLGAGEKLTVAGLNRRAQPYPNKKYSKIPSPRGAPHGN
jgi:hypothetical protein